MPGVGSQPVPKVPLGKLTLAEEREQRRLLRHRGAKGHTAEKREAKSRKTQIAERAVKTEAKMLDGWRCRFPECEVPKGTFWGQLEACHVEAEGMGGSPTLARTTVENLITLCRFRHRGPSSLHSGDVRIELLTPAGTRGPVAFMERARGEGGQWILRGISHPPKPEDISIDEENDL